MGWFGRAERLAGQAEEDSVVPGYLLLPVALQRMSSGDAEGAHRAASEAAEIAQRFGEHDLFATASYPAGAALIKQGRVDEGLQILDEAMVAVTSGEVSPFLAGVVYCGVIASCEEAFEPRRAQEWTEVLTRWCEAQPQLVSFTGRCLAHGAGVLPAGRASPPSRRLRGGRGRVPRCKPLRPRAAAGLGAPAGGTRGSGSRRRRASPRARRDGGAPPAGGPPSGVRRGRPGAGSGRRRRFGECRARRDRRALRAPDAPRHRGAGSWVCRACPWRAAGCAALAPHCVAGVGGARRAV